MYNDFTSGTAHPVGFDLIGRGSDTATGAGQWVMFTQIPEGIAREVDTAIDRGVDGIWNNTGSAIDIHVEPPYWATWWFRTLLSAIFLGSVWAVIRYRVGGLTRQRAWLQQQVAARTAEVVRQKEDIEQAHCNLAILGEIGREITASLDETAIFQTLDRHVHGLLDATTFGIYLLDADAKGLTSAWRVEGGEALPVRQVALAAPDANLARCARDRAAAVACHA